MPPDTLHHLWLHLGWPLLRLLFFLGIGLLVALFIESLNWTHKIAFLAQPLTRFAHFSPTSGASFSLCFFSGMAANSMLAEGYGDQKITRQELLLANLFNSLPSNLLHLPTTFFIAVPLIKGAAVIYIGLTLVAAILRTLAVALLARWLLPVPNSSQQSPEDTLAKQTKQPFRSALRNTGKRFQRRMRKVIRFTVPIYILFYILTEMGFFAIAEGFMANHLSWLSWLSPQSLSVITFQIAAEFTAGLAAAGSLLAAGALSSREIVLALLVGTILAAPVRAIRHQYPAYAGIFEPRLAAWLIVCSQSFRALSMIFVTILYYFCSN